MPGPEHKPVQLISSGCLTYAQGRSLSRGGASSLPRCRVWRWVSHVFLRVAPLICFFTFAVLVGKRKEKQEV